VATGGELAAARELIAAGRRLIVGIAERAVTIADEAFGLGPVEPIDATLTRIESGISGLCQGWNEQQRKVDAAYLRIAALEAEVQRLLCWTVGAYVDAEMEPAHRTRFESHLVTCEACQHEVKELSALADLMGRTDG
jgi:hypothetical protein